MSSGLDEYAALQAALDPERSNGSQHKKRRLEASSSRHQDGPHVAPQHAIPGPSGSSAASEQDISDELQRMKQTMARLEDLLHRRASDPPQASSAQAHSTSPPSSATYQYQLDLHEDNPGETDPPSREARQRWHHLRSVLPPLIDTHLMMHYLFVEADWLMTTLEAPRFVARWKHAYERQAISDVFAVQVLTFVACSALFLADNRKRAIHFAVPIRSLHTKLIKEAIRIVDNMPAMRSGRTEAESCDLIELMLNISLYFRCIGKEVLMAKYTERAVSCCIKAGFENELKPGWLGLTQAQVERRRTIMMEVAMSTKWLAFHCRRDLSQLRLKSFNLGQAHLQSVGQLPPLEAWPQSDDVARTAAAQASHASNRFFAWRTKSDRERDTVRTYISVSTSLTNEIPPLVELVTKTEARLLQPEALALVSKEEMRDFARQTRQILARLKEWFTVILPKAGVGFDRVLNATITSADPVEAKAMANILMLNHAVFYMTSILCRAWLLLSDRLQSLNDAHRDEDPEYAHPNTINSNFLANLKQRSIYHVQHMHASWLPPTFLADMEATVVDNARRCIQTIPVIRALQSQSSSQFYVGWTCQSFLQAAVNLAIPLVRSHHRHHHHQLYAGEAGYASSNTDALRHDIVTIFEAVSQLSDNVMARRTAQVLNRAMRLSGIDRPLAQPDEEDGVEDAWAGEETASTTAGQMQNAAEGLALLSAASSVRTPTDSSATRYTGSEKSSPGLPVLAWEATSRALPSHSHHVAFQEASAPTPYPATTASAPVATAWPEEAVSREPMWWEARLPAETQPQHTQSGSAAHAGNVGGQHHMSDSQLLDELLNFDPSFWQFVVDGAGIPAATTGTASASA